MSLSGKDLDRRQVDPAALPSRRQLALGTFPDEVQPLHLDEVIFSKNYFY
jgi:hypothetical protein